MRGPDFGLGSNLVLDLYACRETKIVFTLAAEKHRKIIHLDRTNVEAPVGPDIKPGAKGHREGSFGSIWTTDVVVVEIGAIPRHAKRDRKAAVVSLSLATSHVTIARPVTKVAGRFRPGRKLEGEPRFQ